MSVSNWEKIGKEMETETQFKVFPREKKINDTKSADCVNNMGFQIVIKFCILHTLKAHPRHSANEGIKQNDSRPLRSVSPWKGGSGATSDHYIQSALLFFCIVNRFNPQQY